MAKNQREVLSKQEAIDRLTRNGVRVVEEFNKDMDRINRLIIWNRPVGLRVRAAIDCLCHYHKFTRAAKA